MQAKTEAYRPRHDKTIDPYEVVKKEHFTYPPTGLDDGILIPSTVLDKEQRRPLGKYLQQRTLPTEIPNAAEHDENGVVHLKHDNGWVTSRGETYYAANYSFDETIPKNHRRRRLVTNLEQDADLLRNWGTVVEIISPSNKSKKGNEYDAETKWRIVNGVFQNFSNDLIGLEYAFRIAAAHDPALQDKARSIAKEVFESVTAYYTHILTPPSEVRPDASAFAILERAVNLMREIRGRTPDHIDDIRTHRETDTPRLALTGAQSFNAEFGIDETIDKKQPNVIIPILGAYDLGPALRAVGYTGRIMYVTPRYKLLTSAKSTGMPRRDNVELDIAQDISKNLQHSPTVLFDDSTGSGHTLMRIMRELDFAKVYPMAVRTLFINDKHKPGPDQFLKLYGDIYAAYFGSPLSKRQSSVFSRCVWKEWHEKYRYAKLGK